MRLMIVLLICISSLSAYSQHFEVFGGVNQNSFYGKTDADYSYYTADYNAGTGFTAGIGIDNIKNKRFRMRLALQFDQYSGNFIAEANSGKAYYQKVTGEVEKSVVSLGIFPLNFKIKKKIDLNFGVEVAGLMDETVSGTGFSASIFNSGSTSWDLAEDYDRFSSRAYYGLKGRIAYQLALSRVILIPQYSYYYGLSSEFKEFPEATKSMRHSFCLGIKRK